MPSLGDRQARLREEEDDSVTTLALNPTKFSFERNDHNAADTLHVTIPLKDAGLDVRLLQNAVGVFYLANADEQGRWQPDPKNARFAGILTKPTRSMPEEDSRTFEMEFLDYTTLFLEAKPFGTSGIPKFSMSLAEAWRTVVSQTPGAEVLADRLVFRGLAAPGPVLGTAVAKRFSKLGRVPTKPRTDAWAVWQQCVGMMGLISFIELDTCVVTTTDAYYTNKTPPRLIMGLNVRSMTEHRTPFFRKGIGLTSFNPATGETVEALWPPLGDPSIQKKTIKAKKVKATAKSSTPKSDPAVTARNNEDREYFTYEATSDPALLTAIAKRVYEERSRQEVEGTISTCEMQVEAVNGTDFDLLTLGSGDNVRIELAQADKSMLMSMKLEGQTTEQMASYLVAKGYDHDVALLMAKNVAQLFTLNPVFHVKKVATSADGDAGEYAAEITYCNRILISGDAAEPSPT